MRLAFLAPASLALLFSALGAPSPAGATAYGELPSVMVIAKSTNKNQVHYAATIDESCSPVGQKPMHPYWRMLEKGPKETEPLTDREMGVLGLERQEVGSDQVGFALRAMPGRRFEAHLTRSPEGKCTSWVETTIAGASARLVSVYAKQKLFGMIDYVELTGQAGGATVTERVSP